MKRRTPLNTLRAFEAVGRHCHVRRAAEELHLTHAALSRQVRILEEQLDVQLFDREKNRMQLTPAGRRFLSVVQHALHTLDEGVLHLDPESLAGELVARMQKEQSFAELQNARARIYNSIGLDPLPARPKSDDLAALSESIKTTMQNWDSGAGLQ